MAGTSGLSSTTAGVAGPVLEWLAGRSAAPTLTAAGTFKVAFLSTVRTNNDNTATPDVEWTSANGYVQTAGGTTGGVLAPTFGAATNGTAGATIVSTSAVTLNNAPAVSWAGNRIQDATATTNKQIWYAPLTGGAKTVNSGDTCTIPSGSLTLNLG